MFGLIWVHFEFDEIRGFVDWRALGSGLRFGSIWVLTCVCLRSLGVIIVVAVEERVVERFEVKVAV